MSEHRPFKIPESVLVVIHTPALDVLLINRADAPDYWQSVTGSKDDLNEDLAQTAVREVFEETGIDCGPGTVAACGPEGLGPGKHLRHLPALAAPLRARA